MPELTLREFRRICRKIVKGMDKITLDEMQSVIACGGKPLVRSSLERMWPASSESLSLEQAYGLFVRYDAPLLQGRLDEDDIATFSGYTIYDIVTDVRCRFLDMEDEAVEFLADFRFENGAVDVQRVINEIERTRLETLELLTRSSGSDTVSIRKAVPPENPPEKVEDPVQRVRGLVVIDPSFCQVQYHIECISEGTCEIVLRLETNSDIRLIRGAHPFENDVFAIVYSPDGNVIAITKQITDQGYSTGPFHLVRGSTVQVVSLGTAFAPPTSHDKHGPPSLLKQNNHKKLSGRFRVTLLNMFEMFDLDGDGVLSRNEFDIFAKASGEEPINDKEWSNLLEQFSGRDGGLTVTGFTELHQCELEDGSPRAVSDANQSLTAIGYDKYLHLINAFPFSLRFDYDEPLELTPSLSLMTKENREFILGHLYQMGIIDESSDLRARTFKTEYFGITIVDRIHSLDNASYKITIEEEKNVKWNFIEGKTGIRPSNSTSEWVLILAYSATAHPFTASYRLERE